VGFLSSRSRRRRRRRDGFELHEPKPVLQSSKLLYTISPPHSSPLSLFYDQNNPTE
jgi:hypothetical protein